MTHSPAGQRLCPWLRSPLSRTLFLYSTNSSAFHKGTLLRGSSLNIVFGALATPAISVVRVTISSIPVAPLDHEFVITNSERGRGSVGGGVGYGWVKGGVGRSGAIRGIKRDTPDNWQKKLTLTTSPIDLPERDANC
jgi:hypothetical protein